MTIASGTFAGLRAAEGDPVSYGADIGGRHVSLNELVGERITFTTTGVLTCRYCGRGTRRRYADGYCYTCFKTLARCDLCVVSPDRCHYHAGTCREPGWGESFCMQPHRVYLANSSGPKVGITRHDGLPGRWLDQGAAQARVLLHTSTRHQAGCVEALLAGYVSDRTDWRALVRGDAMEQDMEALTAGLDADWRRVGHTLPPDVLAGVTWHPEPALRFRYPVLEYPRVVTRLELEPDRPVSGRLTGIKGQYLLFEHGALNSRKLISYHVTLMHGGASEPAAPQLELFD